MVDGVTGLIARPPVADIPGAVFRGQQRAQQNLLFQQQQQELARQQQARGLAGQVIGQQFGGPLGELGQVSPDAFVQLTEALGIPRGDVQRLTAFTDAVKLAGATGNPIQALQQARSRQQALGVPTPEFDQVLQDFQETPQEAAGELQQFGQIVNRLEQAGIIQPPIAEREITVKERGVELREREIEQRRLDRQEAARLRQEQSALRREEFQLTKETNELRRQELQATIDQKKRDLQFNATSSIDAVQSSIDTIGRLLEGEGLEAAAGVSAAFPTLPGTAAADFEAQLESLKSQAFLTQVEKMKGLGALSENEGRKLASAIGALDLTQSDKALRASLNRIQDTLGRAKEKLRVKFNVQPQPTPGPLTPPGGAAPAAVVPLTQAAPIAQPPGPDAVLRGGRSAPRAPALAAPVAPAPGQTFQSGRFTIEVE